MVAAVACLFFFASTVIAFNSWSNSALSDRIESLFVGGDKHRSAVVDAPGPQAVATSATGAAAIVARAPSPPRPAGTPSAGRERGGPARDVGSSASRDEPTVDPVVGGDGSGPVPGRPSGPAPSRAPKTGSSDPEVVSKPNAHAVAPTIGGVVQNTTDTLANTVQQTTGQLGSTVGGVSQPLGDAVTQTGQNLGNTITYTGQPLGGILNGANR